MKDQSSKQTAYEHDAHANRTNNESNDYGWAKPINRMIDQRYAFLALQYDETGYLYRGMNAGCLEALLNDSFWHVLNTSRTDKFEQQLNVIFFSQDISDALNVVRFWENEADACLLVLKSSIFNEALKKRQAAMLATAEPGVVFKYPFITYPLTLNDIRYIFVKPDLINNLKTRTIDQKKLESLLAELTSSGKLLELSLSKTGPSQRKWFEQACLDELEKRGIHSAEVVPSSYKPTKYSNS